jgi:hypothetical protein
LLGNRNPERTWISAMTEYALYLDDGGHPDDQPFLVVAGYVASESQWLAFEPQWRDALTRFDCGTEFHMTDFMADRRKYSTLKFDQILFTLASITKRNTAHLFVGAVDMAAYKRVNDEFALQEWLGAPFAITARVLTKSLNLWRSENLSEEDRLLIFVEEGTKHYGDLEQVFKRDDLPRPIRVCKEMPQVQPSDILAWETFNWLRAGSPSQIGKNLKRLTYSTRKKEEISGMLYETDLRRLCIDTNAPLRASMKPGDTIAFHSERKRKRKRTIK